MAEGSNQAEQKSQSAGELEARLEDLRRQIDDVDARLVDLLNARARVVVEIGDIKRKMGSQQFYSPDREQAVLRNVAKLNTGPLHERTIIAVYRELMSGSFALEKPLKIVYLGPDGSFSHVAARRHFGSSVEYVPVRDIAGVFDWIERENGDYGVVPIENTTGGGITDTLKSFLTTTVTVCAELALPVHHNLLSTTAIGQIRRVYSKPQVFDQCRTWLSHNMPEAELVEMPSTTAAAQRAAGETDSAAIASELAAEIYGLRTVFSAIEDSSQNVTRFLIIGREGPRATGNDKTSILFSVEHKHGALVDSLNALSSRDINLTKIESHPSPFKKWEYYFFVDIEGHQNDATMREALQELRKHCSRLEILGSYPRAVRHEGDA